MIPRKRLHEEDVEVSSSQVVDVLCCIHEVSKKTIRGGSDRCRVGIGKQREDAGDGELDGEGHLDLRAALKDATDLVDSLEHIVLLPRGQTVQQLGRSGDGLVVLCVGVAVRAP